MANLLVGAAVSLLLRVPGLAQIVDGSLVYAVRMAPLFLLGLVLSVGRTPAAVPVSTVVRTLASAPIFVRLANRTLVLAGRLDFGPRRKVGKRGVGLLLLRFGTRSLASSEL